MMFSFKISRYAVNRYLTIFSRNEYGIHRTDYTSHDNDNYDNEYSNPTTCRNRGYNAFDGGYNRFRCGDDRLDRNLYEFNRGCKLYCVNARNIVK